MISTESQRLINRSSRWEISFTDTCSRREYKKGLRNAWICKKQTAIFKRWSKYYCLRRLQVLEQSVKRSRYAIFKQLLIEIRRDGITMKTWLCRHPKNCPASPLSTFQYLSSSSKPRQRQKLQSATQIQGHHDRKPVIQPWWVFKRLGDIEYTVFRDSKIQSSTTILFSAQMQNTTTRPPVTLLMSELLGRWITHLARVLDIDKEGEGGSCCWLLTTCWLVTIVHLVSRDLIKKCNYNNTKQET